MDWFERNPAAVGEFGDFAIWVCVGLAVVGCAARAKFSHVFDHVSLIRVA